MQMLQPTPSNLVPADLRNLQSPKHDPRSEIISVHLHLEIRLTGWFLGKFRSRFSLYWNIFGLFVLEKEHYVWLGVIEPFALRGEPYLT